MAYTKTAWSDRVVQNPLTYTLQNNPDGTVTLIPAEGTVVQSGTPLTASVMNNLEKQYDEALAVTVKKAGDTITGALSITGQPYLEVSKTDVPAIQPSAFTKLIPNILDANIGGGTWAAGVYTVPTSGVYLVHLVTKLANIVAGASQFSGIYVNDVVLDKNRIGQRQNSGLIDDVMVGSIPIKLTTGDKLSAWVFHSDTVARNLNYAYMRIVKLT
jgi:hypothetical protein